MQERWWVSFEGGGGRRSESVSDDEEGEEEDTTREIRRLKLGSADVRAWDFQNSLAFWSAVFFIEGSALFTIGSIALYPSVNVDDAGTAEWKDRAWIDWTFMIGAWCFTAGNFSIYVQVINQKASHRKRTRRGIRLLALPDRHDLGQLGAFFNCIGTILFNINTMTMFDWIADKTTLSGFNLWYFMTGSVGSLFFVAGAVCEGEHNEWRRFSRKRLRELPFLMSVLNFWGGFLFFVAYCVDVNRYADESCSEEGKCALTVWVVCTPFTVGSICFLIASWMSLWMWKAQDFGLSFAKTMVGGSKLSVNKKQQAMLLVYCGNIVMVWCRLGFLLSHDWEYRDTFGFEIGEKLMAYHCILFLVSVVHATPTRTPFNYILWSMRFIAIYGFATDAITLHRDAVGWVPTR